MWKEMLYISLKFNVKWPEMALFNKVFNRCMYYFLFELLIFFNCNKLISEPDMDAYVSRF